MCVIMKFKILKNFRFELFCISILAQTFLKGNFTEFSFHGAQFMHSKNNILAEMDFFCEF
jgi:hypothetical protein